MKPISVIFVLVCLSLVAERLGAIRPGKPEMGLIDKTCALTKHVSLCLSSLTSDPNSFPADKTELALVALRLASSNASDVSECIKVLFNDSSMTAPAIQEGLFLCLGQYLDASQLLDDSIAAIIARSYSDVDRWVKAAIAAARTCEADFGLAPSALKPKNDVFIQLCENALIISQLASGPDHK